MQSQSQTITLAHLSKSFIFLPGDPVNRTCLLPVDAIFELEPLLLLQHRSAAKLEEEDSPKSNFAVFDEENRSHLLVENGQLDCSTLRKRKKDWCLLSLWQRTL